jgi:hypothetical protein
MSGFRALLFLSFFFPCFLLVLFLFVFCLRVFLFFFCCAVCFCVVLFFSLFCVVCWCWLWCCFLLATFGALVAPPSDFGGVFVFGGYVIWPILLNDGGYFPLLMMTPPRCICGVNPLFSGT